MADNKSCCSSLVIIPLAIILLLTLLFYGFGYRLVDAYHVFGWNDRLGKTGEILAVVMGVFGLLVFWLVASTVLAGIPLRYACYFILPVIVSFPVAFAWTPFGHQSFFASVATFLMRGFVVFLLTFFLVLASNKIRALSLKKSRKPLDSLPQKENVTRRDLNAAKKRRAELETFLEKCHQYGSLENFQNTNEYLSKYEKFEEEYETASLDMMVRTDVGIAITEYSLTNDVDQFRQRLSASYRASWEEQDHTVDIFMKRKLRGIVSAIFDSLAVLDTGQAVAQAVFLRKAIRQLRTPLHLTEEAVYIAIVAAVQADMKLLTQATEKLHQARSFVYRLFDDDPGYWMPYITGLATKDVTLCNEGIRIHVEEHVYRISQELDLWYYMDTQALGMANLCRIHGIAVSAIPPVIPEGLLFKPGEPGDGSMFDECFQAY